MNTITLDVYNVDNPFFQVNVEYFYIPVELIETKSTKA